MICRRDVPWLTAVQEEQTTPRSVTKAPGLQFNIVARANLGKRVWVEKHLVIPWNQKHEYKQVATTFKIHKSFSYQQETPFHWLWEYPWGSLCQEPGYDTRYPKMQFHSLLQTWPSNMKPFQQRTRQNRKPAKFHGFIMLNHKNIMTYRWFNLKHLNYLNLFETFPPKKKLRSDTISIVFSSGWASLLDVKNQVLHGC